jgi:hypothetical protein
MQELRLLAARDHWHATLSNKLAFAYRMYAVQLNAIDWTAAFPTMKVEPVGGGG